MRGEEIAKQAEARARMLFTEGKENAGGDIQRLANWFRNFERALEQIEKATTLEEAQRIARKSLYPSNF